MKRIQAWLTILLVVACGRGDAGHSGLFRIAVDQKYGFINKRGKVVIQPQFDFARDFSGSLAAVVIGRSWGYIDPNGKLVINPQFDAALDFSDGLAAVKTGERWGFIDRKGRYAINPQFDQASAFRDGLAPVRVGQRWGFIDKSGKMVINPQFDVAESFDDGRALVGVDQQPAYIDTGGRTIWKPEFDDGSAARRTMADMRMIATAWEARATDMNKYNAAGALPDLAFTVDEDQLDSVLSPTYIKTMPRKDGWGHAFEFRADQQLGGYTAAQQYWIASRGRDGAAEQTLAGGGTTNFDCDIVYSNGTFLQYPASVAQQ